MGAVQIWSFQSLINIYVARHGETTWNVEGRIQGRSDPDLSPMGHVQSQALLEQLKGRSLSAIYTSTLKRSFRTAQPIADHFGLTIQRQPELNEIAFGILEGKQGLDFDGEVKSEWERFKENRFGYRMPEAENYTDVLNRVRPFAEKILQAHQGQEILIVGHRVVNQMLIGVLTNYPPEEMLKIQQSNGCFYLIKKNGETKVFYYNHGEVREGFFSDSPISMTVALGRLGGNTSKAL
jgi:broad specificity phosphatase PhoE